MSLISNNKHISSLYVGEPPSSMAVKEQVPLVSNILNSLQIEGEVVPDDATSTEILQLNNMNLAKILEETISDDDDTGYEQLINYSMLYDSGDECITWNETVTNGGTLTRGAKAINYTSTGKYTTLTTANEVDFTDYEKIVVMYDINSIVGTPLVDIRYGANSDGDSNTVLHRRTISSVGKVVEVVDISTISGEYYLTIQPNAQMTTSTAMNIDIYVIGLVKKDDITTLCSKANVTATSLEELLADTNSLSAIFNSEDAVNFMVAQCTGDFMVGVLNSETAVGLLASSPYLNKVVANVHWAKFMMMLPTAQSLLNYTMLYDEGNECEDVTGGWVASTYKNGSYIGYNAYVTKNKIDLSGYSKILFDVNCTRIGTGPRLRLGLWDKSSYSDSWRPSTSIGFTFEEANATLDDMCILDVSNATELAVFVGAFSNALMATTVSQSKNSDHLYLYHKYTDSELYANLYNIFLTKVDNFQKWALIGGVDATDLDTLLADSTAMNTLMANQKAVDYLAGCTGDLMVAICNSEVAMSALVNNIAYDTLFKHPVWYKFMTMIPTSLSAMDNAPVTASIPTMISNTEPSGVASASANASGVSPYHAFDKQTTTSLHYATSDNTPLTDWEACYEFDEAITPYRVTLSVKTVSQYSPSINYVVETSSDGNTWVAITPTHTLPASVAGVAGTDSLDLILPYGSENFKYIRVRQLSDGQSTGGTYKYYTLGVTELNAYGKVVAE